MKAFIQWVKDLLSSTGSPSTMRFVNVFALINICAMWDIANVLAWIQALKQHWPISLLQFSATAVTVILTVITGKVAQAYVESKCATKEEVPDAPTV